MIELFDVLKALKVNKCYEGMGIIVHPDYRGLGIAQEFLRARYESSFLFEILVYLYYCVPKTVIA